MVQQKARDFKSWGYTAGKREGGARSWRRRGTLWGARRGTRRPTELGNMQDKQVDKTRNALIEIL